MTLTIDQIISAVKILLLIISIIVNIIVIVTIRKSNNKGITDGLEKGAATIGKIFNSLNMDGVKDAITLIKELTTKSTDPAQETQQNADRGP